MAIKTGPDSIYIDGMEGGTGAGPHIATEETGIPGIAAIRQARKALDDLGKTRRDHAWSMPAASATAATWPRRWRSAPTRSPSAIRR